MKMKNVMKKMIENVTLILQKGVLREFLPCLGFSCVSPGIDDK